MEYKTKTPDQQQHGPGVYKAKFESDNNKDTKILDNPDRVRVLNLLRLGFHLSAIDISRILGVHDARSHLRYIRKLFPVESRWKTSNGTRFKVYFIKFRTATTEESQPTNLQ